MIRRFWRWLCSFFKNDGHGGGDSVSVDWQGAPFGGCSNYGGWME